MTDPRTRPSRRRFLKSLALGSALPVAAGVVGRALAFTAPPGAAPPEARPAAPPAASPAAPAELSPDVKALTEVLRRRYGQHLSGDQLEALAPDLDRMVKTGERLRKVTLQNSEEPDFVFRAALPKNAGPRGGSRR